MRYGIFVALAGAPLLMAPLGASAPAIGGGLCHVGEPVVFSCQAGSKWIAVCGKPAQYRFGTSARVELTADRLAYANTPFSGGGETQIVVDQGGYRYVVYSSMVRTGFRTTNDPAFESGVAVQKGGRTVATRKCTDPYDAPVDLDLARKLLPETGFVER